MTELKLLSACTCVLLCCCCARNHAMSLTPYQRGLLDQLEKAKIDYDDWAGTGGPWFYVGPTPLTEAIVGQGNSMIRPLCNRLSKTPSVDEAILIVLCLGELRASQARQDVMDLRKRLKEEAQFAGMKRDLTLEVMIDFYLKASSSWP